jgi:hypothetical protein
MTVTSMPDIVIRSQLIGATLIHLAFHVLYNDQASIGIVF